MNYASSNLVFHSNHYLFILMSLESDVMEIKIKIKKYSNLRKTFFLYISVKRVIL